MDDYPAGRAVHQRYELLWPMLDERLRRLWAAAEAVTIGVGGVAKVAKVTGLSRSTIRVGIKQLAEPDSEWVGVRTGRVRKPGAGRKSVTNRDRGIEADLERLMDGIEEPGPIVWTCKSLRKLAEELGAMGHPVSYRTVANILHRLGYQFGRSGDYKKCSLADRQESFRRISRTAAAFLASGEPILSARSQEPLRAPVAHLVISGLLAWWQKGGLQLYPQARRMMIAADGSVSRGIWTVPMMALANELRLEVVLGYFPPGAWRWSRSIRPVAYSRLLFRTSDRAAEFKAYLDLVSPVQGLSRSTSV